MPQTQNKNFDKQPIFDETVIFFDWDDTCLPSTFLSSRGFRLDTPVEHLEELRGQLCELETSVADMLQSAMCYGSVHIVTNAERGWVQLSCEKFLPGLVPLISRLPVLSARTTYESTFPGAPLKWKFYAFQQRLANSFAEPHKRKNILSLGDSYVEREAIRAVTRGCPNTTCKSVKFAERPSIGQLRRQIELVTNCFQSIVKHNGDLDLQLTVTTNTETTSEESGEEEEMSEGQEQEQNAGSCAQEQMAHSSVPAQPIAGN